MRLPTAQVSAGLTVRRPLPVRIVARSDGQLAGVSVEARHVLRHRRGPVERLRQVGGSLQDDLLRQLLGVPGVSRHQLAQPLEPVVYRGLRQGWKDER